MSRPADQATARGRVVGFDDHRGLGEVEDLGTAGRLPFHCTAIADGTRTIRVGTDVAFRIVTGPLGMIEAAELRPA